MVNFAELKAKAEKAKDVSVTKMTNTRDRYTSVPSSKANWDPHWKRASPGSGASTSAFASTGRAPPPPPPSRSRPDVIASGALPVVPRASRPSDGETDDSPVPPPFIPRPPPTRAAGGYPPSPRVSSHDVVDSDRIDWANLSAEDKEAFFGWLDEFFSGYLGVELGPRAVSSTDDESKHVPLFQKISSGS
ncbi:hypothetical protein L210DRAFT_3676697 [Boletus edulis BED1]|uniref:Uncharacterized protein n=1 Tax=Boletus edulis BED1 TaxID=1328754 RepID=A0AAD4BSK5_BOLED|nr:hypothetical protein L210DRAFT_3676697 [Boletus edulis BED1]